MVELIRLNMFHVYALVHDLYRESGKCIRSIAKWFTRIYWWRCIYSPWRV